MLNLNKKKIITQRNNVRFKGKNSNVHSTHPSQVDY